MDSGKESNCFKNSFIERQKQLNDQLIGIEKSLNKHRNHTSSYVPRLDELSSNLHGRNKIKGFKGRQSIFKRPEGPAPRTNVRAIPDYRRNPTKWKCYSLDDVSDTSNEGNQEAAFAFLEELKKRRQREDQKNKGKDQKQKIRERLRNRRTEEEIVTDDVASSSLDINMETDDSRYQADLDRNMISYQKPQKKELEVEESKPEFRNNKIIMPEYNFGAKKVPKKKKSQKNTSEKVDKNKEMKLDHLQAYEDEEE